jgi:chemotaxis protein MotB
LARIKKIQEQAPSDWQVVFCSLSIILVAFFVMLCSMATPIEGKMVAISRSFKSALNIFSGGVMLEKGDTVVIPSPDKHTQLEEKIAAPIYTFLRGKMLEDKVSIKSNNRFVNVSMLNTVLFKENSFEITRQSKKNLSKLAKILKDVPMPIRIEGHTDNIVVDPLNNTLNFKLSAMRAVKVLKYLQEEGDISSERLSAVGYGPNRPFVSNNLEEDRKRNERVDIIISLAGDYIYSGGNLLRDSPPSFRVWDLSK